MMPPTFKFAKGIVKEDSEDKDGVQSTVAN